jgi:uncharacterized protein (DUF934 family)
MLLDATGEIEDDWRYVADEAPVPPEGQVVVAYPRLPGALEIRPAVGVLLPNDINLADLAPHLARIGLIAVDFPSFADGRGFSIAQRLRDMGYEGRLRAHGPVIADQFAYLLACGCDEVKVTEDVALRQPVDQWTAQLSKISLGYQRGRTGGSILDQRRADA